MEEQIQFSEREQQVIDLLLQGKSNKQIALALGVSLRTVEFHLSNIYAKLGVTSRTEAALKLSKTYLRESADGELRESTGTRMDESDDNVKASISTRRIPMNKSSLIGLGLLIATSAFCVGALYLQVRDRDAAVGAPPTPTSTYPSPQLTEALTLITSLVPPQPTPQDSLGGGTAFDGHFVFDLRLFRDPAFNQHPVATSLYSDMEGIGAWMYWSYTGADAIGPVETYWGTLPQLDQLLQGTYDSIQLGSSGGRTGGVMLPGGFFVPGESKPGDRIQVALKVVTPEGEYGAVLVFTLKQGTNGFEPTHISVDVLKSAISTPSPTVSSKEHILEQIRQFATKYEQAVQAEKKTGNVEFSKDLNTGEEIFLFKDQSYERIEELWTQLSDRINQNEQLYNQMYRDETNPTPFPTQLSTEESKAYYDLLNQHVQDYCPQNYEGTARVANIYNPDDGKYYPLYINDSTARCYLYGKMVEEWRTAPLLAKVNKDADMALIRQITGKPDLQLTFQSISGVPNAPWQSAALYTDETGTKYHVDIGTARLAAIEPNFQSHPNIPANEKKSMAELRGIARQFASTNSPRLADLESVLLYEENCKGAICFFRWDYRNKDWSGTDWAMMPPFLQVGVLTNGQIVTYINTLDLFK